MCIQWVLRTVRRKLIDPNDDVPSQRPWLRISSGCFSSYKSGDRFAEPSIEATARIWYSQDKVHKKSAAAENSWDGFCAICKRPLHMELCDAPERANEIRPDADTETRYAYVIGLWGAGPEYVLGGMVLGCSLQNTGTKHDMIVIHTSDVSQEALCLLKRAGWIPHEIQHVEETGKLCSDFHKRMRFANVFTKLRCFELTQYDKILMMDIDLLVLKNIDDLFEMEPPVAMARGQAAWYNHGDRVSGRFVRGRSC